MRKLRQRFLFYFHPDRGGKTDVSASYNAAYDTIETLNTRPRSEIEAFLHNCILLSNTIEGANFEVEVDESPSPGGYLLTFVIAFMVTRGFINTIGNSKKRKRQK